MATWYRDKVRDSIDVGQAVRDAGKMGETISYLGQGIQKYSKDKYDKKRAIIEDTQKADVNKTKKYVANKGYAGKVDSANIKAGADNKKTAANLKIADIDYDKEKYKSDSFYKKEIDGKALDIKKQKIASGGKVKVAKIGSSAKRYVADKGIEKQTIDNTTKDITSKRSAKTQLEVANINASSKAKKVKKTAAKKQAAKFDLGGSDEDILRRLKESKTNRQIGDFDIS